MPVDMLELGTVYEILFRLPTRCCPHILYPGQQYRVEAMPTMSSVIVSEATTDGQPRYGEMQGHLVKTAAFRVAARKVGADGTIGGTGMHRAND